MSSSILVRIDILDVTYAFPYSPDQLVLQFILDAKNRVLQSYNENLQKTYGISKQVLGEELERCCLTLGDSIFFSLYEHMSAVVNKAEQRLDLKLKLKKHT